MVTVPMLAVLAAFLCMPPHRQSLRLRSKPCASINMVFPDGQSIPMRDVTSSRNQRMAQLLSDLVGAPPEEQTALLERSTELLLEPFRDELQKEGSIFSDGMSMEQKRLTYRMTLTDRIESARSEEVADALCKMRDYTLRVSEPL
eukprot:scaffold133161_cov39-Tisochrysis_lutea.AAC.1